MARGRDDFATLGDLEQVEANRQRQRFLEDLDERFVTAYPDVAQHEDIVGHVVKDHVRQHGAKSIMEDPVGTMRDIAKAARERLEQIRHGDALGDALGDTFGSHPARLGADDGEGDAGEVLDPRERRQFGDFGATLRAQQKKAGLL